MPLPTYDDIIALLKQGAAGKAQERFNALHQRVLNESRHPDCIHTAETQSANRVRIESDGIAQYLIENGKKNGPFCRHCYDKKSKLEKLLPLDAATYVCPTCKMRCERNLCG